MTELSATSINRIVVVRSLPGLGDMLCSVPALRALRAAFPNAHITLLGLPGRSWFVERFSTLLDGWLDFPGFPGIPEGWQSAQAAIAFLDQVQAHPFDLALQMHGNGTHMNAFVTLLASKTSAGFYVPGNFCPSPQTFLPYPEAEPEIWKMLRLVEHLGLPLVGNEMAFPVSRDEQQAFRQLAAICGLQPNRYICLHPGASDESRRWSAQGFAQVADHLAAKGYQIVLTGTPDEQAIVQAVQQEMHSPSISLVGKTNLGTLAACLQNAALLICNDTGVSHLAAALKTPSVVIFSNSEVARWAPLDRQRHRVVDTRAAGITTTASVLVQANELLQPSPQPLPLEEVSHAV